MNRAMRRPAWMAAGLFLSMLSPLTGREARAAECPAIAGGSSSLSSIDSGERLRFIRESVHAAAHKNRIWMVGWGAGYAALTAGQLVAMPFVAREEWPDFYIGAAGSTVGVLSVLVLQPKALKDEKRLDAIALSPDAATSCARLAEAERILVRDAADDDFNHSWLIHAGNFLFNAGLGAILIFGYHRYESGAYSTILGMAIGEIEINTHPVEASRALGRYREGSLGDRARPNGVSWFVAPSVGRVYGLRAGFDF